MTLNNGDVFDIGQTVNGVSKFLWFNNVWHYFEEGILRVYEYDQDELTKTVHNYNDLEEITFIKNIFNETYGGGNNATNNQTAVDIFHNRVNELIEEKKTITTFVIDGIWLECKEMEKEQMIEFAQEVFRNRYNQIYQSLGNIADDIYNKTYGSNK